MKNKLLLGITLVALPLTLAACGSNGKSNANGSSSAKTTMNVKKTVMSKTGEIVGSYNSKDKKVLGLRYLVKRLCLQYRRLKVILHTCILLLCMQRLDQRMVFCT
ncbi:hypothetical protein [Lactiplantibacillus plantarum]|uniref:hypothetical protein n=1 Tax=Lactiplantibacillus plantarum TaxID=1590 RepID=UPI0016516987|nr:hypothetical protein [Lactiplantibacillus plantarum]